MTMIEELRSFWKAKPFAPFVIRMKDGRAFEVTNPRRFHVFPGTGGPAIYFERGTERTTHIHPQQIEGVAPLKKTNGSGDADCVASRSSVDLSEMISMLRKYWQARPFVPFTIHLANGKSLTVPHPEFFWMSQKGGQIFVEDTEVEDEVHVLNPLVIVSVSRESEMVN